MKLETAKKKRKTFGAVISSLKPSVNKILPCCMENGTQNILHQKSRMVSPQSSRI
jgi:hypothetical protein